MSVRAKGLLAAGRVDFQAGEWTRGMRLCAQSRELYREAGEAAGEARALIWLAFNRWGIEDDDEIGGVIAAAIDVARRARAAAGDGDRAGTERNMVVAPRPRSGAASSSRRAGS